MKLFIGKYGPLVDKTVEFALGLNIVTGSNGAGKSTLLEALLWSFYGDSRIRMADAQVEADWEGINAFRYTVEGKTDFVLTIDGKKHSGVREGASVLSEHGFPSLKMLLATIWSKQSELGFISFSPLERRRFISEVLELGKWDEARALVKKKLSQVDSELIRLKSHAGTLGEELTRKVNLVEQLEPLATLAKTTKKPELPTKVDTLSLARLQSEQMELQKKLAGKEKLVASIPEEPHAEAIGRAKDGLENANAGLKQVADRQADIALLRSSIRQAKQAEETLGSIPCAATDFPKVCRFVKDAANSVADVGSLVKQLATMESEDEETKKYWEDKRKLYSESLTTLTETQHLRNVRLRDLVSMDEAETRLTNVQEEIARLESLVAAHDGEADKKHKAWIDSYKYVERIENLQVEIEDYQKRIRTTQEQAEVLQEEVAILDAMEKDFSPKGVPGYLVECALPELAEAANAYLVHFTDEYSIRFSMVKEKVSGGQSETLDILIARGGDEVPVEACSGGERVMVDIAIRMAVRDFVVTRGAILPSLLVLDETLAPLDEANRVRFMQTFLSLSGVDRVVMISHVSDVRELPGNVISL